MEYGVILPSLLSFSLLLLMGAVRAQMPGFVSLDCGGRANFTDDLGLKWTPDDQLMYGETTNISVANETRKQYQTLRFFPADNRKYCYTLKVISRTRYLVRATFLYGNFDNNNVYPKFDISLGATHWATIVVSDASTIEFQELIFLALDSTISVCLSNATTGQPFISTLELRQFNGSVYLTQYESQFYLSTSARINFGADSEAPIRYPDDPFDRIWESDSLKKANYLVDVAPGTEKISTRMPINVNTGERPPQKVMQTAMVGRNGSLTYRLNLDGFPGFGWAFTYFAEIESLGPNETRKFRLVLPGMPDLSKPVVNIQENAQGKYRLYEPGYYNISLPFVLSFRFGKTSDSSMGPLLNAMEINKYIKKSDGSIDESVIASVISLYPSADWAQEGGDPCLPVPWSWVQCNSDPQPRIVKIILSEKNLTGNIPSDLTKLIGLVELWLDGNLLTGPIPDFSGCMDLKIIHLENNQLTGELPSFLVDLPNLGELYVQNNKLSGTVPSHLVDKNLILNYTGNINLHKGNNRGSHIKIIIGSSVGAAVMLVATIASCLLMHKEKMKYLNQDQLEHTKHAQRLVLSLGDGANEAAHCFALSELEDATRKFEKKVGSGGFGVVYYGKLKDGNEIAVKVLTSNSYQGKREFSNEVTLLSRIHHRNLVQFLGYCQEEGKSILVYELMHNGTLKEHLYGPRTQEQSISWIKRLEIAEDAAKGIEYLHTGCVPSIIHRDLKTNNILLDKNMRAKVSDFGLSKLAVEGASHVSSIVRGTVGYLDPEYYISQQLTDKSDVYSFGVILLELISGQEAISNESFGVNCRNIVPWEYVSTQGSQVCADFVLDYTTEFTTEQVFKNKDELLNWVREVGKRNGLVIVIKTSDYGGGKKRPRMYLACERSGQYRATKKLKHDGNNTSRITGTKKCGCPFDMRAHRFTTHDGWTLTVVCGLHNHPPAEQLEGHSYAGRLSNDEKALLMDMSKSMVRPKEILVTLKQRDALNVSTLKTIYNVRHRNRVVQRAGRSQMQYLLGELAKYNYIERHRSEESTMTVTDLFWAHPTSLDLFRSFPRILIMDCTYKTNRYRLPLLEIVGVTSTEMTFSVAFAYLQYERVDNYAWVLATLRDVMDGLAVPTVIVTDRELALMNAIQKIFPSARHLLCRWHISKNVLTKCKKMFETQQKWEKFNHEWNSVVYSSSEIQYEERLKSLLKEFSSYPDVVKYVMDTWLVPYKDKFVAAWTDTCMHCGNVTTNRAESAHAKLKRQLGSCQVSFQASFEKIHSLLELQHTDIKASFEKSLTVVQHQFKPSQFRELRGNVSISALEYLLVEIKRANSIGIDVEACGCVLRHTHGLPCAHEIADYIRQDRSIPLGTIHSQWRQLHISICKKEDETEVTCHAEMELFVNKFNESDRTMRLELLKKLKEIVYPGSTFLVEPEVKPKTRPRDHKKINVSTRRDPCAFELVQSGHDSFSPKDTQITTLASTLQTKKKRPVKGKEKVNPKGKAYITRTVKPGAFLDAFPTGLKPYIKFVKDVAADGNCGFRTIAASIGHTEDDWAEVRRDLLGELHTHKEEYITLYGSYERFEELTSILSYFEDSPGYSHWMTMPDMGHLVASCYNLVLYHLSLQQCLTFLPLRTVPVPQLDRREIAIGFVNGNHFVQVLLQPGHPVPPIATNWRKYRHPCAVDWDDAYVRRIQHFKDIIHDNVATRETFDVVDVA